jgi:hypothetical protein
MAKENEDVPLEFRELVYPQLDDTSIDEVDEQLARPFDAAIERAELDAALGKHTRPEVDLFSVVYPAKLDDVDLDSPVALSKGAGPTSDWDEIIAAPVIAKSDYMSFEEQVALQKTIVRYETETIDGTVWRNGLNSAGEEVWSRAIA